MNERIGDLMYRAGLTAQGCWDEMDAYDRKAIMTLAELVVQECSELTLDHKNDDYYNGWLDYRDEIKRHFGVQE
jgi:hypothetical protein